MSVGSIRTADERVYFFLSYAHTQKFGPRNDPPDKPVRDFYHDLSVQVAALARRSGGAPVGFADWEIQVGRPWRRELGQVLATCGVFLALYSPDYFTRTICGQEWAAFRQRELMHVAHVKQDKAAIIPVLWTRVGDADMPPVARRIHYYLSEAGELYHKRGMRELVIRRRNRPELDEGYRTAVAALAARIIEVADHDPLLPVDAGVLHLDPEADAFAREQGRDDPRSVRFVIVAPVRGRLPNGAVPEMYGNRPEQWRPYWPADETPIAATAAALGESDGFRPIIESLSSCPDLRNGAAPTAPTVLIVDPFSPQDPQLDELLRAFDQVSHEKPWVRLVIPWDKDRSGDGNQMEELERGLERVLDRTRTHCRMLNPEAVAGLATVAAFGQQLPGVIAAAERGYLRSTEAYPPPGETPTLPRLGGVPSEPTRPGRNETTEGNSDVRGD